MKTFRFYFLGTCFLLMAFLAGVIVGSNISPRPTTRSLSWAPGPGSEPQEKDLIASTSSNTILIPQGESRSLIIPPFAGNITTGNDLSSILPLSATTTDHLPSHIVTIHRCKAEDLAVWTSSDDLGCLTPLRFSGPKIDDGKPH